MRKLAHPEAVKGPAKGALGQAVYITMCETKPAEHKGLVLTKVSASVFLADESTDVWFELLFSNDGRQDVTINSIGLRFDAPVQRPVCASYLYEEGRSDPEIPPWSKMYRGFEWASRALCSFNYNIGARQFLAVPYEFDIQFCNDRQSVTLCNFRDKSHRGLLIPACSGQGPVPSATLYVRWTDTQIGEWLDEAATSFDYLIEAPEDLSERIYAHFVLPSGAILTDSSSEPPLTAFNPRRTRVMFRPWQDTYGLYSTRQLRVVRGENTKQDRTDYMYVTGVYTVPEKRFRKQIQVFAVALTSGALFGAVLGAGLSNINQLLGKWTLLTAVGMALVVAVGAVFLIKRVLLK